MKSSHNQYQLGYKERPFILAFLFTVVALATIWHDLPHRSSDSSWYLMMSNGASQDVPLPYAGRLLHTALAGVIARTGLNVEWSFIILAAIAYWVTLSVIFSLHQKGAIPIHLTVFVLLGWFTAALLRDATLPDIHSAAWLAVFIIMAKRRSFWAIPILICALLCRECLILFALVLAWFTWRGKDNRFVLAILAASGIGLALQIYLSGDANIHNVNSLFYLATKSVFNISRNVLGFELYVNTISYSEPAHVWLLPHWLSFGGITEVGVCGFNVHRPLWLLTAWSGIFGIIPGWLWARRKNVKTSWPTFPVWLKACLIYGLLMMVAAPISGTLLDRLTGFAWPAFWLAAPLVAGTLAINRRHIFLLAFIHLTTATAIPWLASNVDWNASRSVETLSAVALAGIALNLAAVVLIKKRATH